MGLSFHYNGSLYPHASLPAMIEEVKDIAEIYKWKYNIYKDRFPKNSFGKSTYNQNIYGISFTPDECETVWLCFLSNGKMSSPVNLQFYGNSQDKAEQEYLYMLSVKTQYAGIEIHQMVIELLRYLSKKYFENFIVSDEGEYWETGDEKLLRKNFKRYTDLLNSFVSALESFPKKSKETFETYFGRLIKHIQSKNKE